MFSSPMNTRRTPACAAFSMKFGILWHSVSTWMVKPIFGQLAGPQRDQAVEQRSQSRLRAKLSSVMKNRLMF